MNYENIVALDLGTTKFCLAVVSGQSESTPPTLKIVSVPAKGMRKGMLSDFSAAEEALSSLLDLAESEFSTFINKICVGIAGSHLRSNVVDHQTPLQNNLPISSGIVSQIDLNLKEIHRDAKSDVIYSEALEYKIDGREWIENPVGFSGRHLKSRHFVIRADRSYLDDIVRLCNNCGVEVVKVFAEPLASSSVVVSEQEKDSGVAIADIGGGTTDGIIFSRGKPIKLFTINIGGHLVSNDLSLGLGVSHEDAERIKRKVNVSQTSSGDEVVKERLLEDRSLSTGNVINVVRPRILELGEHISCELFNSNSLLRSGLILTGGGADIKGITKLFSETVCSSVGRRNPLLPDGQDRQENKCAENHVVLAETRLKDVNLSGKYSTVKGLLYLYAKELAKNAARTKRNKLNSYLQRFSQWLKELT